MSDPRPRRQRIPLPELDLTTFRRRVLEPLAITTRELLDDAAHERLHQHYLLLRQWSTTVSLIGSGTVSAAPSLHYAESLAGLPALPSGPCLDFGSGAGFPGLILAACRPHQDFLLVESRQRKAAFLRQATAAMGLTRCHVLASRWGSDGLEPSSDAGDTERLRPFSVVTARAVNMAEWRQSLERILDAEAVWLAWGEGAAPAGGAWRLVGGYEFSGARALAAYRRS